MIDGKPIRNHPSSMLSTLASIAATLALMLFIMFVNLNDMAEDELSEIKYPAVVVVLFAVFVTYRVWKNTTYTFGPNELVVKRDLVMKRETNIQYSKLSSVNVQRGIINKLFGTTTLLFNVNSSVNTAKAEATLTLKRDEADMLRQELSELVFRKGAPLKEEKEIETVVEVSNAEIILHGLIGQPTVTTLVGIASFIFSVATVMFGDGESLLLGIVMLVISIVPGWIHNILRYSNYRIYRVGDTVTIQSGLIRNYRISFNVSKINSVRIREPAIARLMGKSILEAEVVGLSDSGVPLLCPLKDNDTVLRTMMALVPEHVFEPGSYGQPGNAFAPMMLQRVLWSIPFVLFSASAVSFGYVGMIPEPDVRLVVLVILLAAGIGIPVFLIVHGLLAQRQRTFDMKGDAFVFVTGAYDRVTEFFIYDKVQTTQVRAGPLQRKFGVASCIVSILSSVGFKKVQSGLFSPEDLEKISTETMARIKDGRYDFKRYL